MLTFINGFLLWFIYFPVVCYCLVFFDQEPRPVRDAEKIKRERKLSILFVGLCFLCNFLLVCLFIGFIFNYGLGSKQVEYTGKTLGTVSFVFALITWIPQIVTTIRLRDPGSFSIILLLLQAPGGTLSSLFMMIGQGDDWSTWLGSLTAAIQMYVLLGFCIYFKYKKRKAQKAAEFSKDPLINQNSSTFSEME
ncbi:PQ loop repeat family protein [Histomonas meleagridis]|uniref:PQ loop repeat family protein n=1 Tax=Histomonas meleagridis TaxID=135588 RepID=UPI00355A8BAA|nr:PQ loop repeat family protein [Histomonas meleagridis]KAH0801277.1 PQ loop repeat family protein [Histomonas meleagridis]